MKKDRIDNLLQARGLADSPAMALALVMSGVVLVDERRVDKPSELFPADAAIRLKGAESETGYVGRGGLKLQRALEYFKISPAGSFCLDVGASTGGFTDCLLQRGAAKVIAVDAGTNQLAWKLRIDPRVVVHENTNARSLASETLGTDAKFDLIVMDVSFISVTKIIPALVPLLAPDGKMIVLIKPQFEAAKGDVGPGGIVRDAETHLRTVDSVNHFAVNHGLKVIGVTDSPILGAAGNKEFLVAYENQ